MLTPRASFAKSPPPSTVEPAAVKSSDTPAAVESSDTLAAVEPPDTPAAVEPAAVESSDTPAAVEPATVEPAAVEPATVEPATVEPAAVEPSDTPATVEPAAVEPATVKSSDTPARSTFIVVSDNIGFVGAYPTVASAQEALRPYIGVPFAYGEWARHAVVDDGGEEVIWILPYRANNVVACASNDKAVVEATQRVLLCLDLVHSDEVKYWEAVVGTTHALAAERLDRVVESFKAATKLPVDENKANSDGVSRELDKNNNDSKTIADFLKFAAQGDPEAEPERINLLESVVPCDLFETKGASCSTG
jgi:hypothetical protein